MMNFIIAANWKMNKTPKETLEFIKEFKSQFKNKAQRDILFFPSFLGLPTFRQEFLETPIRYGAQNCYYQASGAYTGEVSVGMLKAYGCGYSLVGHSERRTLFHESDELVALKVKALEGEDVVPVICIGETLSEREQGQALQVVERQMLSALTQHTLGKSMIFAYEPVWAIGTGKVPTLEEISQVHSFLRQTLIKKLGSEGSSVPLLYGGSVNAQNAKSIEAVTDVNGFLIGGASLKVSSLLEIY